MGAPPGFSSLFVGRRPILTDLDGTAAGAPASPSGSRFGSPVCGRPHFRGCCGHDCHHRPARNLVDLIGVYRPGFSYRPEQAIQALRKARYCQVSIYQVHPGSEPKFAELVRSRRIAFDSMNLDRPDLAYVENIVAEGAKTGGLTREHLLFRIEPATSWVSDDFASADPEFWRGKAKTP